MSSRIAGTIRYFTEDISFDLPEKRKTSVWIKSAIQEEKFAVKEINYIFCSDKYLLDINRQYLDHDTLTDIITFDNSDADDTISSDIYISIERVKENAIKFNHSFLSELHRVMIHGVLHLCGYKDKTQEEEQEMRLKEDHYIARWS